MATVINNPGTSQDSGGGMGFFLGTLILLLIFVLFIVYGLPMIRQSFFSAPQINVPGKIDINVNQPGSKGSQ